MIMVALQISEANSGLVIDPIHEMELVMPVCDNHPGEIFVLPSGSINGFNFQWTPSAGLDCPTCPSVLVDITETTTFTLTASDIGGNCTEVDSITVEYFDYPMPIISIIDPSPVCEGMSVAFECLYPDYTYQWTGPGGFYSEDCGPVFTDIDLTNAGMYCVTITDPNGCQLEGCIDLVVGPIVDFEIIADADTVCAGESVQLSLDISNPGMYAYFWNGFNLSDPTIQNPTCTPEDPVSIYEAIIIDVNTGCESIDSIEIIVEEDCVWPGDTDTNGVVNNFDLLNIGLGFDSIGPIRPNATFNWEGQVAPDWTLSFPNGSNFKHADTDGNGIINSADTTAITLNWGETHNFMPPLEEKGLNTPFYVAPDSLVPNMPYSLEVILGDQDNPAVDIYGIAFSITYDPQVIVPGTANLSVSPSWLGVAGNDLLMIQKDFHAQGRLDIGLTRIDGMNISGTGEIGRFNIIVEDIIFANGGNLEKTLEETSFGIENVRVINFEGEEIPVNNTITSTPIILSTKPDILPTNSITVIPNPVQHTAFISAKGLDIESVQLLDQLGRVILNQQLSTPSTTYQINFPTVPDGIYLLHVKTKSGNWIDRIQIQQ